MKPSAQGKPDRVGVTRLARLLLASLLPFLLTLVAGAQTNEDASDASFQGRQLAQKILNLAPPESSTITGTMRIHDDNGSRPPIPVACIILADGSNWECCYQASGTNAAATLRIEHRGLEPNRYFLTTGAAATSAKTDPGDALTGAEIMAPFVGSDFCLADLGLEFFHWPGQKVLKLEIHRSRGCTVLESTNPSPAPGQYSRVVSWIDSETLGIVEAYAYDSNGQKLKDFYPKDFKKVAGRWQVQTLEMENLQTGSRSRLVFDFKK